MAQSILSKINFSREGLQSLQQEMADTRDEVCNRGATLKKQWSAQSTKAAGRLRDASLTTIYELGASTLSKAADFSGRVPVVNKGAGGLRERAKALEQARENVQRPPIDDYDELNVKQVADELDELSIYELEKVRQYEAANKDRVTVLRDVERRLDR